MGQLTRRVLGRVVWVSQRILPRLETRYAQLESSTALAPGASAPEQERLLLRYYEGLRAFLERLPQPVHFTVVVEARAATPQHTAEARRCLELQVHQDFDVVVLTDPEATLLGAASISERTGWVVLTDARDRLLPNALAEIARWITANRELGRPDPQLVYADDRDISWSGEPLGQPTLRPGWSPLLHLAGALTPRMVILDRETFTEVPETATMTTAALLATRRPASHVGHIPQVLTQSRRDPDGERNPSPNTTVLRDARSQFCAARGWPTPMPDSAPSTALRFPVPGPAPRVSIIIPTRDRVDLLRGCVHSVLQRSTYPDLEVLIVDNDSRETATHDYLRTAVTDSRVSMVTFPGPFNFGAMNNTAAQQASGSVLVLLNNDTEVVRPDWLEILVGLTSLAGVGAVGPQLRYADGRVQHAGLAGLAEAGTGHEFVAAAPDQSTPLNLLQRTHEVLAVTGACLAITKDHFSGVGGFDEVLVPNDAGDVDLCLRLRASGLTNVYTPATHLIHHESKSRGSSFVNFERLHLQQRWPAELLADPYWNPNLAKTTRMTADPRFPVADVPGALLDRWLEAGSLISLDESHRHDEGDGQSGVMTQRQ